MSYIDKRLLEEHQFVQDLLDIPNVGRQMVFSMIRTNWKVFQTLHPKLRSDKEVLIAAVKEDWHAMDFVPKDDDGINTFWSDEDVVLEAVAQDWEAVNKMNEDLWQDMKIVKAAIRIHAPAIYSAPKPIQRELWGDRDIVKT